MMARSYTLQITTISALFFFFGFVTWTNSILVPYLQIACELSSFQSYLVTTAFYGAYFVMAFPSSVVLNKVGYKNGIVFGLFACATGTLLFIPAALYRFYPLFLLALYVVGTGLALLQTAANPYVSLIGSPEGATSRINIVGVCGSLAGMLAPHIFGSIALKDADNLKEQAASLTGVLKVALLNDLSHRVIFPYMIMTAVLIGLALLIRFSSLPEIEKETASSKGGTHSFFDYPHLVLGVLAIFCYVGVEVLAIDSLVNYANFQGFTLENAKQFPAFAVGAMLAGRFAGIFLIGKSIKSHTALAFNSAVAVLLVIVVLLTNGLTSIWSLVALGLCHSIMWAAIFPLAIAQLGEYTKRASSYLIMAIVGGAIIPPTYGYLVDKTANLQSGYALLIPCYLFLFYYGWKGYQVKSANA